MPGVADRLAALTPPQRRDLIATMTPAERQALLERLRGETALVTDPLRHVTPERWLAIMRPGAFDPARGAAPFGWFHREAIDHVWAIGNGPVQPLGMLFFRGGAKSTIAETIPVRLGALGLRRYCLYISGAQDQADDHVDEIGAILEGNGTAVHYPAMADRDIGKFGNSKGWRRNRLRTSSGVIIDALGLDTARARGAKLEDQRPDMLILDDIDSEADSGLIVSRKLRALSSKIMPALADNCVIVLAQNLIHRNSVANQVHSGATDLLSGMRFIGPVPGIVDLDVEVAEGGGTVITGGTPSWEGYGLDRAQQAIDNMGFGAFSAEVQQDIEERPGALLSRAAFDATRVASAPDDLDDIIVSIDPNKTGRGDDAGVTVMGASVHPESGLRHVYVLADYSELSDPATWRDAAVRAGIRHGAGAYVVESAGLGQHAALTIQGSPLWNDESARPIYDAPTELGKKDRARPVAQFYLDKRVHHVGRFPYLEGQWTTWEPDVDSVSPGAVDSSTHGVTRLLMGSGGGTRVRRLG